MAFRFPLATLLRMREITEQREERLLGQIQNQIVLSRQTLADLKVQRRDLCTQRELALRQSTFALNIEDHYAQVRRIDEMEAAGREQLAKLIALREHQLKIYELSYRNRELISGMRAKGLEGFQAEQARREQSAMDDSFSSRRTGPRQSLPSK